MMTTEQQGSITHKESEEWYQLFWPSKRSNFLKKEFPGKQTSRGLRSQGLEYILLSFAKRVVQANVSNVPRDSP